ncbi:MAG: hypothetical protein AAF696_04845, partial [Bacteroidota bacterium]
YYAWFREKEVAMFILGKPNTFKYCNYKKQKLKGFDFNLGRSLHKIPKSEKVSLVDKSDPEHWYIKSWNPQNNELKMLIECMRGQEDYCWTPDGRILMGSKGALFIYDPQKGDKVWKKLGDLGIGTFQRLACSPKGDMIALVVNKN